MNTSADTRTIELSQYFTPSWAADALVEEFFPDLGIWDRVIEPSCGPGAFLSAIPDYVPAIGVEIDPALVERARANTGREIILGDFTTADIPFAPTVIVGNPPYKQAVMQGFFDRAWSLLPDGGRCGMLLPVYTFQTPSVIERLAGRWHIQQSMVPRTLFPRLRLPLCFAMLTKGKRGLVGFSLYHQAAAVSRLRTRYRALLAAGEGSAWKATVQAAMEILGGTCTLAELYAEIEGNRPTTNPFWQAKVRQVVQKMGVRVGPGTWHLPKAPLMEAA